VEGIFFAVLTVISWGMWLAPSQRISFKNQQIKIFYVSAANLVLAFFVGLVQGFQHLTLDTFWFPFIGGLIWAVSGYFAFLGTSRIGMAKAVGIWAPMNLLVSIVWGILLFGEFLKTGILNIILSSIAVLTVIAGILLIIFAKGKSEGEESASNSKFIKSGILGAIGAGILWGSYFIPIRLSDISMWVAAFPMAVGIFTGSTILALMTRTSFLLKKPSHYARVFLTGLLWGIGNYASLRMMELIGTGKGFSIAQLNVAFHALIGIFIFKEVEPRSKAAVKTLAGIALALAGAILLGNLK
jgi:glucose uptake protein